LKYVMFKSGAAASSAILGKHVDVCETGSGTSAYQAARAGKLILLVDLGSETVPFFPDSKNLKQLGYPFTTLLEYGLVTKAGVPEEIRYNKQVINAYLGEEDITYSRLGA